MYAHFHKMIFIAFKSISNTIQCLKFINLLPSDYQTKQLCHKIPALSHFTWGTALDILIRGSKKCANFSVPTYQPLAWLCWIYPESGNSVRDQDYSTSQMQNDNKNNMHSFLLLVFMVSVTFTRNIIAHHHHCTI